jgi:hypothetical protein
MRHLVTWFIATFLFFFYSSVSFSSARRLSSFSSFSSSYSEELGQEELASRSRYQDRLINSPENAKKTYQKRWGKTFAASESVGAIMAFAEEHALTSVIEAEAGYGFNAVYAAEFNEKNKRVTPVNWVCYDSGKDPIFGRSHPWYERNQNFFKAPETVSPEKIFLDSSGASTSGASKSFLAFFSPSKENGEAFKRTIENFLKAGGLYVGVVSPIKFFSESEYWELSLQVEVPSFKYDEKQYLFIFRSLSNEVNSLLLREVNGRKDYKSSLFAYAGQRKSCESFLSLLKDNSKKRLSWQKIFSEELAARNPETLYKKQFGSIFAAPDVVTSSLDLLISQNAEVSQILELEAGYGFNAVYAANHPLMKKATWKCFDSKENEDHLWFQGAKHFSPSEKAAPLDVFDRSQNFRSSVLALLNPLESEEEYTKIVTKFREKNGKYLILLVKKSFKETYLYRNLLFVLGSEIVEEKISQRFEDEEPKKLFFFTFGS